MCGIIWVKQRNGKSALKKLRKMYHNQAHRGTQGYGFVAVENNGVSELTRARYENEIMQALAPCRSSEILFHHRTPTSTINTPETAHPIPVSNKNLKYDYLVVHNGIIYNNDETKKKFEALGYKYTTEIQSGYLSNDTFYADSKTKYNDSESLAIDIAIAIEEEKKEIESTGSIAFIALQMEKETRIPVKLFYGRNNRNPLKMEVTNYLLSLSSEGAGVDVVPHKLHYIDYATGEIVTLRDLAIGALNDNVSTPKYTSHYHGRVYDYEKDEMGYKTPEQKQLPESKKEIAIPDYDAEIAEEIENFGLRDDLQLIEGGEISINLTYTTETYRYYQEIEFDYINLVEDIEYWNDYKTDALARNEPDEALQAESMIELCTADRLIYEKTIKELFPDLFAEYFDGNTETDNVAIANA